MNLTDLVTHHMEEPTYLELFPADAEQYSALSRVPIEVSRLLEHFIRAVCEEFPDDALPALYSPHALTNLLLQRVRQPDFTPTDRLRFLFEQMILHPAFLFDALRAPEQPSGQRSLGELALSRTEISHMPDKDITLFLDFAVALGTPGNTLFDYTSARAFLAHPHTDVPADHRFTRLLDCYGQLAKALRMTVCELVNAVQNCLRQVVLNCKDETVLTQRLHDAFQTLLAPEGSLPPVDLSQAISSEPMLYGICSFDDLFRRTAHVFCDIQSTRSVLFSFVRHLTFSREQVQRMVPLELQISACSRSETPKAVDLLHAIQENLNQTIRACCDDNDPLHAETLSRLSLRLWADHDSRLPAPAIHTLLDILEGYFSADKSRIHPQKQREASEKLIHVCMNTNLFRISRAEGEDVPLAPLLLFLAAVNQPSLFSSRAPARWDLTKTLLDVPLSVRTAARQRHFIGLYLRLRKFFLRHVSYLETTCAPSELACIWDQIFCGLTGYNGAFTLFTDGKPDTFSADEFALERSFRTMYFTPVCSQLLPQHPDVRHEEVFHWMQAHDQNSPPVDARIRMASHPNWVHAYRRLLSRPSYRADYDDFWRQCRAALPLQDLLVQIPPYPYPDNPSVFARATRFTPELYLRAVLETQLRDAVVQEDIPNLWFIASKLYSQLPKCKRIPERP